MKRFKSLLIVIQNCIFFWGGDNILDLWSLFRTLFKITVQNKKFEKHENQEEIEGKAKVIFHQHQAFQCQF